MKKLTTAPAPTVASTAFLFIVGTIALNYALTADIPRLFAITIGIVVGLADGMMMMYWSIAYLVDRRERDTDFERNIAEIYTFEPKPTTGYSPHDLPEPPVNVVSPTWIDPALWNELGRPRPNSGLQYADGGSYPDQPKNKGTHPYKPYERYHGRSQ